MKLHLVPVKTAIPVRIQHLYESAFPLYERRPWPEQQQLLHNNQLQLLEIIDENIFTGFIFFWPLSNFTFVEHFALTASSRGKGTGSSVMQLLAEKFPVIVLETETKEKSADAGRRIVFYEKLGYRPFPYAYKQPSYAPGYPAQEMILMHRGGALLHTAFEKIKNEIYRVVYPVSS